MFAQSIVWERWIYANAKQDCETQQLIYMIALNLKVQLETFYSMEYEPNIKVWLSGLTDNAPWSEWITTKILPTNLKKKQQKMKLFKGKSTRITFFYCQF